MELDRRQIDAGEEIMTREQELDYQRRIYDAASKRLARMEQQRIVVAGRKVIDERRKRRYLARLDKRINECRAEKAKAGLRIVALGGRVNK